MRSGHVVDGQAVHRQLLDEMLSAALKALSAQPQTPESAWKSILKNDDIIGIKFNRSAQEILGTTNTLAEVLIESLLESGWRAKQLVCIEAPAGIEARYGTMPAREGYSALPVDFGSGTDQLAAVLEQVTAIINVPYLKSHNIAGMTCALKNLSHGLVKHPGRYHANGCSPYIADIAAVEQIRSKLRLCVVDALRIVFANGPAASLGTISDEGILLVSADPVAVDSVGLLQLNDARRRRGLSDIARSAEEVAYLAGAHRKGLGVAITHGIDLVAIDR